MNYDDVMAMPIRTFWMMVRMADRLEAKGDLRAMTIAMVPNIAEDKINTLRDRLIIEAGEVVKMDKSVAPPAAEPQRDETGFAELRLMAGQKIGR